MRKVADRTVGGRIDPDREETLELLPRLVEHTERRVAGAGDLAGLLEDPVEPRLRVVLGDHSPSCGLQQTPDLFAFARTRSSEPRDDYTPDSRARGEWSG